jgi:hypothetical protein
MIIKSSIPCVILYEDTSQKTKIRLTFNWREQKEEKLSYSFKDRINGLFLGFCLTKIVIHGLQVGSAFLPERFTNRIEIFLDIYWFDGQL